MRSREGVPLIHRTGRCNTCPYLKPSNKSRRVGSFAPPNSLSSQIDTSLIKYLSKYVLTKTTTANSERIILRPKRNLKVDSFYNEPIKLTLSMLMIDLIIDFLNLSLLYLEMN